MNEIVKINLDNEMDLILAHKRTLKLGELCGLSLPSQTTFATAVSEIARCAISYSNKSHMLLGINNLRLNKKEIVASIYDTVDLTRENSEAVSYAQRLMGQLEAIKHKDSYEIRLTYAIPFSGLITEAKISSFIEYFQTEPPISPYDEIRKKNIQLIDLSKKLQQSEKLYQTLTDTLPLMMFSINLKGEMIYSNKWLRDYFNITSPIVTGTSWQKLVHRDDYKSIWKAWDESQLNHTVFRAQCRLINKKDEYIWHLITIVPVKNERQVLLNWIGFFVDIHAEKLVEETLNDNKELKLAQENLERYQEQLEQKINELNTSNNSLEQFAYIASHDLQEPLRKIKTFSNLLESELDLNAEHKQYFAKIKRSSDRMSLLIKDVLAYSRLVHSDEGMTDTDLNTIVENVLIDLELLIHDKGAQIKVSNLPVLKVLSLQISQVFANIIHNALKFSVENPVIEIMSREVLGADIKDSGNLDPGKKYFHITISDNGIGFEEQYQNRIFDIFQKLNSTSYEGTGIGLALCKRIVERHEGYISAEGASDRGAIFNIYLPHKD